MEIKSVGTSRNDIYTARVVIKNTSNSLSLLNKIKLKDKKSGDSILPVFFSYDYITLLPKEEKIITFSVEEKKFKTGSSEI